MCGIVGVIDNNLIAPKLTVDGLKKLEYRGYDSWGVGWLNEDLELKKGLGGISESGFTAQVKAKQAIGHTRWATHGMVSEDNAHPHADCQNKLLLVHNGIIENYQQLKGRLTKRGHRFGSQTDSEVIVHLLEDYLQEKDFLIALQQTIDDLAGQFAIVILDKTTGYIWACRRNSPLLIGLSSTRTYVASDAQAFDSSIDRVLNPEDNLIIKLAETVEIFDKSGKVEFISKIYKPQHLLAKKGNFDTFTLKEISEQPESLLAALSRSQAEMEKIAKIINNAYGLFMVGAGSAYNAGLTASYLFSRIAKKHINISLASEFPNYEHFLTKKTVLFAISQSGETADTLDAVRVAQAKGNQVIALVNVKGSTLDRLADYSIPLQVGPEVGVLATKSLTGQIAFLQLLAYAVAGQFKEGKLELEKVSDQSRLMLTDAYFESIRGVAHRLADKQHLYVLGRGLNFPTALEAALKIKEVSYIHAEAFAGGELKHGPIALIESGTPVIGFVAEDENYESMISNLNEVKTRGAQIIGISSVNNGIFDSWIKIPEVADMMPIVAAIPAQLIGYFLAVARDLNPDRPRNLAKSVTVK